MHHNKLIFKFFIGFTAPYNCIGRYRDRRPSNKLHKQCLHLFLLIHSHISTSDEASEMSNRWIFHIILTFTVFIRFFLNQQRYLQMRKQTINEQVIKILYSQIFYTSLSPFNQKRTINNKQQMNPSQELHVPVFYST
jgi:hypothetical protein